MRLHVSPLPQRRSLPAAAWRLALALAWLPAVSSSSAPQTPPPASPSQNAHRNPPPESSLVHLVPQQPVRITRLAPNLHLPDFGRVAFGDLRLNPHPSAQGTVTVHFGEAFHLRAVSLMAEVAGTLTLELR